MALRRCAQLLPPSLRGERQRVTVSCRFSSNVPSQVSGKQGRQDSAQPVQGEDAWTEVVDTKTGQTYYWNQQTGETTKLGEPKPSGRRGAEADGEEYEEGATTSTLPQGWREPVEPDHTFYYASLGVGIGILGGWLCQFTH